MNDEVETVPTPAKPPRDNANGVTRPVGGSKTGQVWDIADDISASAKRPALREEVMKAATDAGINKGTIATQYARWTQYHNVSAADRRAVREMNRPPKPVKPPKVAATAEATA